MENRAAKSGIARDVQNKINSKYEVPRAAEVMSWVSRVTGESINTSGEADSVYEELKDGHLLMKLMKAIRPSGVPDKFMKKQTMAFKQMEQIAHFNAECKNLGVSDNSLFATNDLMERVNMGQVIICLEALGRKCHDPSIPVEGYGVKESQRNTREFTEEQLKQGQNIIGLQMGSNKGANQSGQSFGKGRMIVD